MKCSAFAVEHILCADIQVTLKPQARQLLKQKSSRSKSNKRTQKKNEHDKENEDSHPTIALFSKPLDLKVIHLFTFVELRDRHFYLQFSIS